MACKRATSLFARNLGVELRSLQALKPSPHFVEVYGYTGPINEPHDMVMKLYGGDILKFCFQQRPLPLKVLPPSSTPTSSTTSAEVDTGVSSSTQRQLAA